MFQILITKKTLSHWRALVQIKVWMTYFCQPQKPISFMYFTAYSIQQCILFLQLILVTSSPMEKKYGVHIIVSNKSKWTCVECTHTYLITSTHQIQVSLSFPSTSYMDAFRNTQCAISIAPHTQFVCTHTRANFQKEKITKRPLTMILCGEYRGKSVEKK